MEECQVCAEEIRNAKVCPMCHYKACTTCLQRYLLDSHLEPHCMNCHRAWDRTVLSSMFTQRFLQNQLRQKRQELVFERERTRFPSTLSLITRQKEEKELLGDIGKIRHMLNERLLRLRELRTNGESRFKSGHPCPLEECRGYIDDSNGMCGLCAKTVCLRCNKESHSGSECREEDLAQWHEVKTTTRPCPSCRVRIFKISGCDQMWCPMCRTAFSWSTGRIQRGQVHNPHYYEWLFRDGGEEPQEAPPQPCVQNIPSAHALLTRRLSLRSDQNYLTSFHRLLVHIRQVELRKLTQNRDLTLDLRISYLQGVMDETNFKKRLLRRENRHVREMEMRRVIEMLLQAGLDIMNNFISNSSDWPEVKASIENLVKYFNDTMRKVGQDYKCKTPRVNDSTLAFSRYV